MLDHENSIPASMSFALLCSKLSMRCNYNSMSCGTRRESYPKRFDWLLLTFPSLGSVSHVEVAQVRALPVGELRCVVSFTRGVLCCPLPDTNAEAVPGHFRFEFDDSSLRSPGKYSGEKFCNQNCHVVKCLFQLLQRLFGRAGKTNEGIHSFQPLLLIHLMQWSPKQDLIMVCDFDHPSQSYPVLPLSSTLHLTTNHS